jgi:hypothetical protein
MENKEFDIWSGSYEQKIVMEKDKQVEVEKSKAQPKVGRVWVNGNTLSGYVVVAPGVCLKFAGNLESSPTFLFLSKK